MALLHFSPVLVPNPISYFLLPNRTTTILPRTRTRHPVLAFDTNASSQKSTKLVTFLGKGGSGKTTSAVFAAQHFAMAGLSTCLVIHTQDPTAELLLNCTIGSSPVRCAYNSNLSTLRFETTKMLLESLKELKQADAHLSMTGGALQGIVAEEFGVLPGMDSIFSALALERHVGFFSEVAQRNHKKDKFDIIIYDGMSSEEMLRMISAAREGRSYLKYLRKVAEKTDLGRLSRFLKGEKRREKWESLSKMLEKGWSAFSNPHKFGCFLVMDPHNPASVTCALRYWGSTILAGAEVSGAFAIASPNVTTKESLLNETFSPLPFAFIPYLSLAKPPPPRDWTEIINNTAGEEARKILLNNTNTSAEERKSVEFNPDQKTLTLFMPGFKESEITLNKRRGEFKLSVEAGDQRRVFYLPSQAHGQVRGFKYENNNLVIKVQ